MMVKEQLVGVHETEHSPMSAVRLKESYSYADTNVNTCIIGVLFYYHPK